ncbi:ABC-type Fe3+ transport system, substrate-binding protein [Magnetospirillum fulvum]|uniref:ABC-type Fe3+ transport system, substrate-binding protein n=2 Tax=Magnetospirillum fulvum TaxID=1082 RepID=A0A1H6JH67_MAGFU|nr:ABC-type Fe3+ transport system, substrate-binding protein [Magnetospirillum fulvum]
MFQSRTLRAGEPETATWRATERDASMSGPGRWDLLGRVPMPLRRPVRAELERALRGHDLAWSVLMGGAWDAPFDEMLALGSADDLPGMVITSWAPDALSAHLLATYPGGACPPAELHPACAEAGLIDPLGCFSVFAVFLLVFLVDRRRLGDRPPPRCWSDLLGPLYRGDVVFGGWRPNDRVPFTDYNQFLLLGLFEQFGAEGIRAFAASVKALRHNVVSAKIAGSGHPDGAAVTVLPWMQAEMSPRRDRVAVVWPEDGAWAMPIGTMSRPERRVRLQPVFECLSGPTLGRVLARNCYPPVGGAAAQAAFPAQARLKWLGWDHVRAHDMAERTRHAGRLFFDSWGG